MEELVNRKVTAGSGGRRWRARLLTALAGAMVVLLAACSSSSSGSSNGGQTAGGPSIAGSSTSLSGSPITVMTVTSLNSQGPVYPMIQETAPVYAKWINAHAGINGHPLPV